MVAGLQRVAGRWWNHAGLPSATFLILTLELLKAAWNKQGFLIIIKHTSWQGESFTRKQLSTNCKEKPAAFLNDLLAVCGPNDVTGNKTSE